MTRTTRTPVWWLRTESVDEVTLHGVSTREHRDGAVVDVVALPPGRAPGGPRVIRARMRPGSRQLLSVEVLGPMAADAPALVVHEVVRRDLRPVEVHVVAFLHDDAATLAAERGLAAVPPGTVLTAGDVRSLGLAERDQVGAVRWNPATGQTLEIYVDPGYRRRRVGTCLLATAEAAAVARGWPSLWAGGVRTALGEAMRVSLGWGDPRRFRPLTTLAPPMTPPGEEAGRLVGRPRPGA